MAKHRIVDVRAQAWKFKMIMHWSLSTLLSIWDIGTLHIRVTNEGYIAMLE